jgi:hypothetical protein
LTNPIGPLLPADEQLGHQIADTFATVGTSDPSWTEKICAIAMARDGSVQVGFGLGKYTNRNVMDGYAALSRGAEQLTVRASRRLSPEPDVTAIGPIRYDVLEPLRRVRFALDENECQPLAFEWIFEGAVPPVIEDRSFMRATYRTSTDLVRYHQTGVAASGWIAIDGERIDIDPDDWVSTRDHSWGVRYDVGLPARDVEGATRVIPPGVGFMMIWSPTLLERADGSRYALHLHFQWYTAPGFEQMEVIAGVEHPDGRREPILGIRPDLRFDLENRRLLGGTLRAQMADGSERPITIEVLGDTGVHLGAGLYFGFDGHHHGEFRGALHVDGERIADCREPATARRLHQLRDTAIRITDPVGGGTGWGNCQPMAVGPWPDLGLADDNWV